MVFVHLLQIEKKWRFFRSIFLEFYRASRIAIHSNKQIKSSVSFISKNSKMNSFYCFITKALWFSCNLHQFVDFYLYSNDRSLFFPRRGSFWNRHPAMLNAYSHGLCSLIFTLQPHFSASVIAKKLVLVQNWRNKWCFSCNSNCRGLCFPKSGRFFKTHNGISWSK